MIDYNLKIDLQGDRIRHTGIMFTSGDNQGYALNLSFYSYGEKMDVSGYALTVKAKRADGQVIVDSGITEGTVARYVVADNMYAVSGEVKLEVGLVGAGGSLVTSCVLICSVREGFGEKTLDSKNTSPALAKAAAAAKKAELAAEEARDSIANVKSELVEQLSGKVDAEEGKGLSTNDYTDEEKQKVTDARTLASSNKSNINTLVEKLKEKVDAEEGKGLSTNDYDDIEKIKVGDTYEQVNRLLVSLDETRQTVNGLSKNTLIVTKSNERTITDCADGPVTSLNLYGYCMQNGTPSPSTPAPIYPVEAPYFRGCGADISTMNPDILFGVPVASGGNFTDENGQEWICDEIDFVNKKYIKRCEFYTFTGNEGTYLSGSGWHIDGVATSIYIKAFVGDKVCGNTTSNAQNCMSPYFKASKRNFTDAPTTNDVCCANGEFAYLRFTNTTVGIISTDTDAEKLAKAKEYLAACYAQGNPISILYPIATPAETEFTDEVALAEFAKMQTTYPSVTVESNANFLIGYTANVQNYIDKKFEKLTSAIISLGGNV